MEGHFCRVCRAIRENKKILAKEYFLGTKKEYEYDMCSECGSLFLNKIPDELTELYAKYYSFSLTKPVPILKKFVYKKIINGGGFGRFLSNFFNKQDDLPIKSLAPIKLSYKDRILDVGCGSGSLLKLLYDLGFKNSMGIDPFLDSDKKFPNAPILKKMEIFDLKERFDLIMFHHVFEHFPLLKDTLKKVCSLLSEKGVCIIRIPDIDSYSFMKYQENWFSIHAPFHLALPSRRGMKIIVEESGLIIEKILGEQLFEFFFYSMGHELGIADYEKYGNRGFFEKNGKNKIPPLHVKSQIDEAVQRVKQVKKYDLCDWVTYYLKKK
jgi:SAM-dependent methyltransferase